MKGIIFLISLIAFLSQVVGQKKACDICEISSRKPDTVYLADFRIIQEQKNIFPNIRLVDVRADVSKIGYHGSKGHNYAPCQLENGTAVAFNRLLQSSLANQIPIPTSDSIIGIMHRFWIYEYDSLRSNNNSLNAFNRCNKMVFSADYFLKINDDYYPFMRIDTSFIIVAGGLKGKREAINILLDAHTEKALSINLQNVIKRKKYYWNQINATFPSYAPNLSDSMMAQGIYTTYEEFVNNKPSLPFHSINEAKLADVLYTTDEKGSPSPVREVWGYHDGHHAYIKLGDNYFRLLKVGNTYEVFGFTNLSARVYYKGGGAMTPPVPIGGGLGVSVSANGARSVDLRVYSFPIQLDIVTGDIY